MSLLNLIRLVINRILEKPLFSSYELVGIGRLSGLFELRKSVEMF